MITKLIITGYSILLGAVLANFIADYFNISTWYHFLNNILKTGLTQAILEESVISVIWLFFIYPIILSFSFIVGNKFHVFLMQ